LLRTTQVDTTVNFHRCKNLVKMPFGTLNVYVEGAVNIKDSSLIGITYPSVPQINLATSFLLLPDGFQSFHVSDKVI
jgi:hypothetical protein